MRAAGHGLKAASSAPQLERLGWRETAKDVPAMFPNDPHSQTSSSTAPAPHEPPRAHAPCPFFVQAQRVIPRVGCWLQLEERRRGWTVVESVVVV